MLKSETNPGGLPINVFDGIRAFYGYNRPGAKISEGVSLRDAPVTSIWASPQNFVRR